MLTKHMLSIDTVYVPAKRNRTLEPPKVDSIAESMLEEGQKTPIRVRKDGERFVLIEGLHRLEALKALGEDSVAAYIVKARQH